MRVFQKGFHYCQDGPGNRVAAHLQGCNFLDLSPDIQEDIIARLDPASVSM